MIGKLKRHLKEACMGERGKDEDRERGRLRIRERVCVYTCGYRSVNGRRDAGIATAEDTMVLKREREREREKEREREHRGPRKSAFLNHSLPRPISVLNILSITLFLFL